MREFTAAHSASVTDYCGTVLSVFEATLSEHSAAFSQYKTLLDRLRQSRDAVLKNGWSMWSGVDEAHNELCVAASILGSPGYPIWRLEYEPPGDNGSHTIDFRVSAADGRVWLIDVKTIAPQVIDRWEQFDKARRSGWLPDGALVFPRDALGGELWHLKFATRSRMLEYTLELEQKLKSYALLDPDTTVMMLCSDGFDWHEDELEDFVAFYVDGRHCRDDALASREQHAVEAGSVQLPRHVRRFGYLECNRQMIEPSVVNWYVRPPMLPASFGAAV